MGVIDLFPFLDEFECLTIRLHELAHQVDYHVAIESPVTFQGGARKIALAGKRLRNYQHLARYLRGEEPGQGAERLQVIRVPAPLAAMEPFALERQQFDYGMYDGPLLRWEIIASDLVMISAADEIPRAARVREAVAYLRETAQTGAARAVLFGMPLHYYWLNCQSSAGVWWGTRMAFARDVHTTWNGSLYTLRLSADGLRLTDAGWHFSYLSGAAPDGIARIQRKLAAYGHSQYNVAPLNTAEHLRRCIDRGLDPFDRGDTYRRVPIDETYPLCVREGVAAGGEYAPFVWAETMRGTHR